MRWWQRYGDNHHLVPGRTHRFRVQIDGDRFRQWIDGQLVLDYTDTFPTTSGYLALYGYFPGKAFDDIRIWQKQVAHYVSPLAIGDSAYQFGRYEDAAEVYARISQSHAGNSTGEQALFRQGLAERRLLRHDLADATWERLAPGTLRRRADVIRLGDVAEAGEWDVFVARFRDQWQGNLEVHRDLRLIWQQVAWPRRTNRSVAERLFLLREALFPGDSPSNFVAASLLSYLGRYDEVISRYPSERREVAQALLAMGRTDEVLASDWTISDERMMARWIRGEMHLIADDTSVFANRRGLALAKLGRGEEALALPGEAHPPLLHLARAEEIIADPEAKPDMLRSALLVLGRWDELAGEGLPGRPGTGLDQRALTLLWRLDEAEQLQKGPLPYYRMLESLISGQPDGARGWRAQVRPNTDLRNRTRWFSTVVAVPFIDRLFGEADALDRSLRHARDHLRSVYSGRAGLVAAAVLDGDERAGWESSTLRTEIEALQAVAAALRAELADDRAAALAAWQAYRALPLHRRLLDEHSLDTDLECFVDWRLAELAR